MFQVRNKGNAGKSHGWRQIRRLGCALFQLAILGQPHGATPPLPPPPDHYFNDYAGVVSPTTRQRLEQQLEAFEKETSNQILVVLFPKMESDSSIEDYTIQLARSWRVGQKARNNGAILFIFVQDRKMRIEVGYGLEGALPDAIAKRIIEEEIKPHFQGGDFDGGVVAGVNAMVQATRGEYQGTGGTAAQGGGGSGLPVWIFFLFIGLIVLFALGRLRHRGTVYRRGGRSVYWGPWWFGGGGGGGGGSWSGGGGGFSGGGGSFGGGGASGSW
jgi:uncharacterized protein